MPIDGRQPAQTFPVLPSTYWATVRWTRDGKALLHNSAIGDRTNVWLQPLAGGEPQRITSFADQSILGFDVSADGKSLVIARGQLSRDAVMIRGF
jgi:Tol biopolymer transport system component